MSAPLLPTLTAAVVLAVFMASDSVAVPARLHIEATLEGSDSVPSDIVDAATVLLAAAGFAPSAEAEEDAPSLTIEFTGKETSRRTEFTGEEGETLRILGLALEGKVTWTSAGESRSFEVSVQEEFRAYTFNKTAEAEDPGFHHAGLFLHQSPPLPERLGTLLFPDPGKRSAFLLRLLEADHSQLREPLLLSLLKYEAIDLSPGLPTLLAIFPETGSPDTTAELLSRIGGRQVIDFFLETMRSDTAREDHRSAAIRALGNFPTPEVIDILIETFAAVHSPRDEPALGDAFRTLGKAATPRLLEALARPDHQGAAARMLGTTGDRDAIPLLIDLLGHEDVNLRGAAAHALGHFRSPAALESLAAQARTSSPDRLPALYALGMIEAWEEIDLLLAALDEGGDEAAFAILGLEELSGERLGKDPAAWRAWWEAHRQLARIPPPADPEITELNLPDAGGPVTLSLVRLPGGTYRGDIDSTLVEPFHIGRTEVTQWQFQSLMGENPSSHQDPGLPVHNVTWHEAVEFCKRLSEHTGRTFRLPTEAEWEYACRGGITTPVFYIRERRDAYAWTRANSDGRPQPVATLRANPFGLFDTYGNVAEWCGGHSTSDTSRPILGGSFLSSAPRSGTRDRGSIAWIGYIGRNPPRRPDIGFRVVMEDAGVPADDAPENSR